MPAVHRTLIGLLTSVPLLQLYSNGTPAALTINLQRFRRANGAMSALVPSNTLCKIRKLRVWGLFHLQILVNLLLTCQEYDDLL